MIVQANVACAEVMRSVPNAKIRNSTLMKAIADLRRRHQENAKLQRDMCADLEDR